LGGVVVGAVNVLAFNALALVKQRRKAPVIPPLKGRE
jgi:hypothetical protein